MLGTQAADASKTFLLNEITLDIFTNDGPSFLSLLSPTSISSVELKKRIAAARETNTDDETYRIYYCGQHLRDEDKIPLEIFETTGTDPLFQPRCKRESIGFYYSHVVYLVIVFAATKLSEDERDDPIHLNRGRYTNSYHWKSFQSEKRGLSGRLSSAKLQANMSTDILKNHFQLEEELVKIQCQQYIPALTQAGFLQDEVNYTVWFSSLANLHTF